MKFIDHPLALAIVFLCGSFGVAVTIWVTVSGYFAHERFSWELCLFGVFWLWGACSSGKRLFKRKRQTDEVAVE